MPTVGMRARWQRQLEVFFGGRGVLVASVVAVFGFGVYFDIITLLAGRYRKIHLSCNGIQCVNA